MRLIVFGTYAGLELSVVVMRAILQRTSTVWRKWVVSDNLITR